MQEDEAVGLFDQLGVSLCGETGISAAEIFTHLLRPRFGAYLPSCRLTQNCPVPSKVDPLFANLDEQCKGA